LLLWLVTGFAAMGLLVALVGLYGTMSYMVSQRRREMGVRIALGAGASTICGLVVGRGVRIALLGVTFGLAGTLAARRLIESQLFGITALDIPSLALAATTLLAAAIPACAIPARRAIRVDPVEALRSE
jgi:ABC-type antimicrobial peptide transport system permease subunit